MIELKNNQLSLSFPEVHPNANLNIEFQRTLRLPDDNQTYPLPPGLGRFPLKHIDDYKHKLPANWYSHGGVFMPIYQSEALWIHFNYPQYGIEYPFALKIAAGKINALTGEPWSNHLNGSERVSAIQDYVVTPDQPWLDGFCLSPGKVRQFVAMPLGQEFTAEEQITGQAVVGGLQIIAYPLKRDEYEKLLELEKNDYRYSDLSGPMLCGVSEMGLAPGGIMRQQVFEDKFGIDAWDQNCFSRCFVHLMNSEQYEAVVGEKSPTKPPTPEQYSTAGLPWFDYWNEEAKTHSGSDTLADLDGVASIVIKKGMPPIEDNQPIEPQEVVDLSVKKRLVREGTF